MFGIFFQIVALCALFATTIFGVSEDPSAILEQIKQKGTFAVLSKYRAFLTEIAQDLQTSPIKNSPDAEQQRTAWLDDFTKYEKEVNQLFTLKRSAESLQHKTRQDIEDLHKQLAEKLAKAEDYKISAHQIIYLAKTADAAHTESHEVSKDLWPVSPDSKDIIWNSQKTHVLTVSFMAKATYDKYWLPNISDGELTLTDRNSWISLVPQLKNLLKEHAQSSSHYSVNDRARQILGLPPEKDSVERVYVEAWIKPEDLLRPCADNQIDDKECIPDYYDRGEDVFTKVIKGQNVVVQTTGDTWQTWYLKERKDKYTGSSPFPWTRLGYTLDYRSPTNKPIGVSEYITKGGTIVKIKGAYTPQEYVKLSD